MAAKFIDRETGKTLVADNEDVEREADADPSLSRVFPSPVVFVDDQTGKRYAAGDRATYEEAQADNTLRRATADELTKFQEQTRIKERKEVETKAGEEFLRRQPLRTAVAAGAQAFAKLTLPVVGGLIERAAGLPAEEQTEIAEASPLGTMGGKVLGVAGLLAPIIATGGAAGAALGAGEAAAATTAATGGGRVAQALAAARAAGTLAPAARAASVAEAVSPVISAATRAGTATQAGLTALAPEVAATRAGAAAIGAASAAAGIGATLPLQYAEAKLENREMSGESVALQMGLGALLSGSISGVAQHFKTASKFSANTEAGREYLAKLGKSRADRIYAAHAPNLATPVTKQVGMPAQIELVNEAADKGLVGPFMDPLKMYHGVKNELNRVGESIGEIAQLTDEANGGAAQNVTKMWDRIVDDVVKPLSKTGDLEDQRVARELLDEIESRRNAFPGDNLTMQELSDMRTKISSRIYGATEFMIKDPNRTEFYNALRQVRHAMTNEIGERAVAAGVPKPLWKAAQREYQVASHAERIATKSALRAARDAGFDSFDRFANYASVATALFGGLTKGAMLRGGMAAVKYIKPRAAAQYEELVMRAIKNNAPQPIVNDLTALAKQRADEATLGISTVAEAPSSVMQQKSLDLYGDILDAEQMGLPSAYNSSIKQAKSILEAGYNDAAAAARSAGLSPNELDGDILGDAIESARNILQKASIPTRTGVPTPKTRSIIEANRQGYETLRNLRDSFTSVLADPAATFGTARAQRTLDEMIRQQAVHTDPSRLARLRALGEATGLTKKQIQEKSYRLMGAPAGVTARGFKKKETQQQSQVMRDAIDQAVNDAAADVASGGD